MDHASGGVIPLPVARAIENFSRDLLREGDFAWPKWLAMCETVRRKIAAWIHADPSEIAFVTSSSQGMNFIAELLADQGKVLTNESEFPTSTLPWLWRKTPVIFQKPEQAQISLTKLKSQLTPDVRTIVTSFVQYATGFRQDLNALGKMKGDRYLVVNATQGFGAFPIDVKKSNTDFLCSNSYKWLLAGYGGGILFIKKKWLQKFKPLSVGWRSMREPERMDNQKLDLRQDAARYEWGCPSFSSIFAMGAAVDYLSSIGIEKIAARILSLTAFAVQELKKRGFEVLTPEEESNRGGIVVFKTSNPFKVWQRCIQKKIFISVRGPGLRLAPHFYNTFEEIERAIQMVAQARSNPK